MNFIINAICNLLALIIIMFCGVMFLGCLFNLNLLNLIMEVAHGL